jgi:hypothetical protein
MVFPIPCYTNHFFFVIPDWKCNNNLPGLLPALKEGFECSSLPGYAFVFFVGLIFWGAASILWQRVIFWVKGGKA